MAVVRKLRPMPAEVAPGRSLADSEDYVRICYYGEPGSWKTSHAAALAHLGKVAWIKADPGLKRKPLLDIGVPVDNIEIYTDITFVGLQLLQQKLYAELQDDPNAYAGVVIDSVTEVNKLLLGDVALENAQTKGGRSATRYDVTDYNENNTQLGQLIRQYQQLPCHLVFTALERRDIDKNDGMVRYGPSLTPAVQGDLVAFVDMLCHTFVELIGEEEWGVGTFSPVGKYMGKDRFKVVPKRMPFPTMERIIGYADGSLTLETDEVYAKLRAQLAALKEGRAANA